MKKIIFSLFLLIFTSRISYSQEVYQNVSNINIYDFIDELANCGIISVNSVVKPYSRMFIAEKLKESSEKSQQLNKRQKDELEFYLKDFNKELPGLETTDFFAKKFIFKKKGIPDKRIDLFYYKDSLTTITVNPVFGVNYFYNKNGANYHRWNGLEASAYVGKNWGFYASLRDNYESELFAKSAYITPQTGGCIKPSSKGGGDFEEMKGGATYSWKWGSIGLVKDNLTWGNNYNGANIISNKAPSFPFLKLHLNPVKWFDFNYIHGWLVSRVIDSLRTYNYNNGSRIIYRQKYIAANMFTFSPFKKLNISFGNSIIYSDIGVQPGFLIPIMFFKAVDHSQNGMNNYGGQNAQMFFDISSRQIKHVHLYSSLYVDEINIGNMRDKQKQSNFISFKCGFSVSDYPFRNFMIFSEYTRTNPITYKHFIPATTFESNLYTLGNYLKDNSDEWFFCLRYKPLRGLHVDVSYLFARKGPDYPYTGIGSSGLGMPFMDTVNWYKKDLSLQVSYEAFNDIFLFAAFSNSLIKDDLKFYTPVYFQGSTNTINFGINWGF
ncbi:MAG: capsule assembly Wzi family protein [Bacteroidetes bacterium]|nr:capsule assembly Wzi family protein [Bacteroidota bacterium]